MPACRIFRLARTMRWAIVGSGATKAAAISAVDRPHTQRSVSAILAARSRAG
jgi:hypothetical protein